MRKSKILMVTICSNRKNKGGVREYKKELSIFSLLPSYEKKILERRNQAWELLKSNESTREGMPIKDLPYNLELKKGPDFGGSSSSRYMPAYKRYSGRFYNEIRKEINENEWPLKETSHHVLIISGLYGLITADEMIQLYSCHLPDNQNIEALWKKNGFLTNLIIAYIRKFSILKVFDLTAQDLYRKLINWDRVKKKCEVLHAFGDQNAGPAVLPSLGIFAKENLLTESEKELLKISSQETFLNGYEEIKLFETESPPAGYPKEESGKEISIEEESYTEFKNTQFERTEKPNDQTDISHHPRDILVTSRGHNTIFGKKITEKKDLPNEVQYIIDNISLSNDVISVIFGRFRSKGPKTAEFSVKLFEPKESQGHINAKLSGQGTIGRTQEISIKVTKGMEKIVYWTLIGILKEKNCS